MRYPLTLAVDLAKYIAGKKLHGERKFALALTLDLFGATSARPSVNNSHAQGTLTVEQCLAAVDECGAPIISVFGGEPLEYEDIGRLSKELLDRGKHVFLCTDGTLIRRRLHMIRPDTRFFWSVRLDGLEQAQDTVAGRTGIFREAIDGIKSAKNAGFLICVETNIGPRTDVRKIAELYALLHELHVDGYKLRPVYSNAATAGRNDLSFREQLNAKFRDVRERLGVYNLMISPMYLQYLCGERELSCAAWASPTFTPRGWSGPCSLLDDSAEPAFRDLLEKTIWENSGRGLDMRCEDCMAPAGYETAAVLSVNRKLGDTWRMLEWLFDRDMGDKKPELDSTSPGHHGSLPGSRIPTPIHSRKAGPPGIDDAPELISTGDRSEPR